MNQTYKRLSGFFLTTAALTSISLGTGGCSSAPVQPPPTKVAEPAETEIHKLFSELNSHIQILEAKLSSMNDKVDATKTSLEQLISEQKTKPTPVLAAPSENTKSLVDSTPTSTETAFVNDAAIQSFRKAMILIKGQQYSEAILAFSEFIDHFPDHVLAGSAQFYIGEAYFKEKEYKLAVRELQHVLTSYDRSPHISDALLRISQAEDALKNTTEAAKHRQLLSSIFPQSPAMDTQPLQDVEKNIEKNSPDRSSIDQPPTAPLTPPPTASVTHFNP